MKLIINADDFGFSKSINIGIIDAYNEGLISTTTIMINMPYAEDAIKLWKQNKKLGLGLHINITVGKPISHNVPSIVDNNGVFNYIRKWENHKFDYIDVYKEVKSQIEKLKQYDVTIDHLDCHHDLMSNTIFRKVFFDLALEYKLPVRSDNEEARYEAKTNNIKTTDYWCSDFYKGNAQYKTIIKYVDSNKEANSIEIMTHVGYIDDDTRNRTSHLSREEEINELKKLKETGFYKKYKLSTYKDL
ncbi:MAG: ChbG/HpnK family deacetylase [Clostridia bacterium]|nr:ChbG/HpnK family deacetylase [Clostridia bacterium]MDD4387036.1 ChbG/HpnK family deacetylase [Clostridia bacterium]